MTGRLVRSQSEVRWPIALAAALTFGTGAIDVMALTHLGGVFASVITGNLVFTGFAIARADATLIAHTVAAIGGFMLGVAVGTRVTGARDPDGPRWPRPVTLALGVEMLVLSAFTAGWEATGTAPSGSAQLGLLAMAAISMGLQSAATRGLGVPVATTYLTGTLTGVIAALSGSPRSRGDTAGVAALLAAVAGAVCGGVLLSTVPAAAPLLALTPLTVVLAAAGQYHRRRARGPASKRPSVERAKEPPVCYYATATRSRVDALRTAKPLPDRR